MRRFCVNFLVIALFLMLDICSIGLTGYPFVQSVFCYTLVTFLYYSFCPAFYTAFLLLGFESFIAFDLFGLNYLYLIPLFAGVKLTTYYLASRQVTAFLFVIAAVVCQALFLHFFELKQGGLGACTFYEIGANLLILFISLKWFSTAERGNRF